MDFDQKRVLQWTEKSSLRELRRLWVSVPATISWSLRNECLKIMGSAPDVVDREWQIKGASCPIPGYERRTGIAPDTPAAHKQAHLLNDPAFRTGSVGTYLGWLDDTSGSTMMKVTERGPLVPAW
jgi:hypothetical protein